MAYGKISSKQREILEYIKQEILNKGYPPAVREICEAVHLKSTSSVHSHLETLDKILVQKQSDAQNGDIVVALVDDSATVKTFYKEDGHFRLQPENDTMDPIIVNECSILGKVFGIMRFLN